MIQVAAAQAIIARLAEENRRVLSNWRAVVLLRRATAEIPEGERRWKDAPRGINDVRLLLRQMVGRRELKPLPMHHEARHLGDEPGATFERFHQYRHLLYEVTVPYARTGPVQEDEVLMEVHPFAALAYLSALAYHQLTNALPKEITAMIPRNGSGDQLPPGTDATDWKELALVAGYAEPFILGQPVSWRRVKAELYFGFALYRPHGYPVRVTTPERTLLDGLLHPELCGGLQTVLNAWRLARDLLDLDALVAFIDRFDVAVLRQRVGFILDELRLDHPIVASWPAHTRRGGSSKLLGSAPYAPTYSERWNLSINAPVAALHEGMA
jgi:hypothetical protein